MKKIINGKTYNTETAALLACYSRNGVSDFAYVWEGLYRTKKGRYFIQGEGGAASKYAESYGLNEWGSGEDLYPVSEAEAKEWMERHGDADDYVAAFGEPEEA